MKYINLEEATTLVTPPLTTNSTPIKLHTPLFDESIFDSLPLLLKKGCEVLEDAITKDVFLLSALSCISSCLPQYYTIYNGDKYFSNLNVYIVGVSGSGKGAMDYAQSLMQVIETQRLNEFCEQDKKKRLFIPIDNTATLFKQMLYENEGMGLLYENEGTTLAKAFESEHGDYSDVFRKSFKHETIRCSRKGDKLDITIKKPKLTACLSSTFGQLTHIIQDAEDGTFSRFAFYETPTDLDSLDFQDVFSPQKNQYVAVFEGLAGEFGMFYQATQKGYHQFELTLLQQTVLYTYFRTEKRKLLEKLGTDINGTVNRLAVIWVRLAMLLTILRQYESNALQYEILCCEDIDFEVAKKIFDIIKQNAISLFLRLPKNNKVVSSEHTYKANIKTLWASGKFKKQSELAAFLHVGQSYISQVLNGKK